MRDDGTVVARPAPARHQGPRRAALPGLGPGRHRRATAAIWLRAPRLLLDEHGHDARLPVPLQLVRQADLGPALQRPQPGERRRRAAPGSSRPIKPDHIWFADDIFGLKPGWLAAFADLVEPRDARVPFKCLQRADLLLRTGDIDALAAPAPRSSGSAPSRARRRSSTRWRRARRSSRSTRPPAGCTRRHRGRLLPAVRLPGETRDDIERTLQMVRDCQPDDIGMSVSYPLPGTPFYERVQDAAGRQAELVDSDDLAMLYAARSPPPSIASCTACCIASSARARLGRLRARCARPGALRPRHAARALPPMAVCRCCRLPLLRLAARSAAPAPPHEGLRTPLPVEPRCQD